MKILLNGNTQAEVDPQEPLLLPLDKLELEFCSNVYRLNTLIVTVKNEEKKEQFKVKAPFKLDISSFIKCGTIDINISMSIHTTVVKEWVVPTLYLKEVEHQFILTPEIAKLREDISDLKKAVRELTDLLKVNNII
jgi:hypothetical protein